MDIEFLSIAVLALLIGYVIGKLRRPDQTGSNSQYDSVNCSESYIQGLNYLLANKADKAIELFVELIKVDGDTIETHLALGNLFRSRGEVDRAIKIHQNLLAKPNLDQTQRVMAIKELAEDYLKAGLLDRAENLYRELIEINPKNKTALKKLFELYSLEKSWREALTVAQKLVDLGDVESKIILTHSLCEIAQSEITKGSLKQAQIYLNQALKVDEKCIRALLLLIDLHLRNHAISRARKLLDQLVKTSPEFIELYLLPAREIYLQNGSLNQFLDFLHQQYSSNGKPAIAQEILDCLLTVEKHSELVAFLSQALQKTPSLSLYDFAFRYLQSRPQFQQQLMPGLGLGIGSVTAYSNAFVCQNCGYGSQTMQWHCPTCNRWSTIKPV